jgi:hypothetical protein
MSTFVTGPPHAAPGIPCGPKWGEEIVPVPHATDKMGQPILVGSFIVYGTLLGRCAALKIGRVEKIRATWGGGGWARVGTDEYPLTPEWHITVRSVDDSWSHCPAKASQKLGTLMFPNRMLVIPQSMVTAEYLTMLGVQ